MTTGVRGFARSRTDSDADTLALSEPIKPYPPVEVSKRFAVLPRIEAIAVYEGEVACTNA